MERVELDVLINETREWARLLKENQLPKYPDRIQMKSFLAECGANFEALKGHEASMKKWSDKGMSEAMNAIWGPKWKEIKKWNEEFIQSYEEKTGKELPSIPVYKKGTKEVVGRSKQGSMKHILGVMTRWAAFKADEDPEFDEKRFFREIQTRVINGYQRQGVLPPILLPLERPDTGEIYHPSVPMEYPLALVNKLIEGIKVA